MTMQLDTGSLRLQSLKMSWPSLSIFRGLLDDHVFVGLHRLIDCLVDLDGIDTFFECYNSFYYALVCQGCTSLPDYLTDCLLYRDNPYSLQIASGKRSNGLSRAVEHDLNCLQRISGFSSGNVKSQVISQFNSTGDEARAIEDLPTWENVFNERGVNTPAAVFKLALAEKDYWGQCIEALTDFYRQQGTGVFARYRAFYWVHEGSSGYPRGIDEPDSVTLSDLIGYEAERAEVIENTRQFLQGYPANNVLLYGDRGTGKSSTVKALLNEYHTRGLRLIEVPKANLVDFPQIVSNLWGRLQKYIIFVDDLSFEDNEDSYTAMKAVLEGGLASKPRNVLIYATSNRRHLVKERFSDRTQSSDRDDEIRAADTMQEKLSFSDRFGITVVFPTPDQEKYLDIVKGLADRRGLHSDHEALQREALKWSLWHNGHSPRTARQFIDWLEGNQSIS